jgi:hypothetical protein
MPNGLIFTRFSRPPLRTASEFCTAFEESKNATKIVILTPAAALQRASLQSVSKQALNVGQDAVNGNQQKNATFFGRVEKYYHKHRTFDSGRNWSSLKHRWGTIKKEVSIFQGFHESVERRNESGKTSNDIFGWSAQVGSDFFSHCCFARLSMRKQCSHSYKRRLSVYSMHGTPFGISQSGQPDDNPGMEKTMLKVPMVMKKLIPMLKDHQEGRLRRRRESVQIRTPILSSKS